MDIVTTITAMIDQLQAWMDKRGYNQVQAAEVLGISTSLLCYWLKGERKPNRANMKKLADVVKINPRDML